MQQNPWFGFRVLHLITCCISICQLLMFHMYIHLCFMLVFACLPICHISICNLFVCFFVPYMPLHHHAMCCMSFYWLLLSTHMCFMYQLAWLSICCIPISQLLLSTRLCFIYSLVCCLYVVYLSLNRFGLPLCLICWFVCFTISNSCIFWLALYAFTCCYLVFHAYPFCFFVSHAFIILLSYLMLLRVVWSH